MYLTNGLNKLRKEELRCWAEINLEALRHNFRFVQNYVGAKVGLIPVIKANAYGHGLIHAAAALKSEKVALFGVTHLQEALALRALKGFEKAPILLLSPCLKTEIQDVVSQHLVPVISTYQEVEWFEKAVPLLKKKAYPVQVKIDTGMGRLGTWHEEALDLLKRVLHSKELKLAAVATHFASSDEDKALTKKQWKRFQTCLAQLKYEKGAFKVHAANSAAILNHPETHADWVRPGLVLYGISPVASFQSRLQPVLQWKTRVTLIKEVSAGRTLSYGATYRAKKKQRVAIVSAGYADGYPRALSNQGKVVIQGKRCPILGRITMDQMIVDVSLLPDVRLGEEVVLIGKEVSANELARLTGTISYEIFCGIGERVPRIKV